MKIKPLFLLLPTLILSNSTAWALSLKEAPIQHVTLYPNAAKIERTLQVKAGDKIVSLEGLPANFDISQLQYQTQGVEVSAFTHSDSSVNKPSGKESQQLQNQIKSLEDQISSQNAIIKSAELQNKFLVNLSKGSGTKVRREAYDAFIAADQATKEKKELEQRLAELNADLNQIGDHNFNQRQLKFYLQTPTAGTINISYIVPYARWQAMYKAELDSQSKQLKLVRIAMLNQKTGEDWDNVKLTLSTAMPSGLIQAINPEPWWVDFYQPQPVRRAEYSSEKAQAIMPLATQAQDSPPAFPQFKQQELNFSAEFRSDTPTSINSGQQQILLPLKTEQYAVNLATWVIPQKSDQAILSVELPQIDQQWPAGNIKLYRDGDYVGQQNLSQTYADRLHINFGVDEQVKLQRVELLDKKIALGNGQSQTRQQQRYIVENKHSYLINLVFIDAVPQSKNSLLSTVSSYSTAPTQTDWQGQPHINQWLIPLAAKQKFELQSEHQFKYPNKGTTSGF